MRLIKSALAGACALGFFIGMAQAEPVKIRLSWIVPVANWAPMIEAKKDLAQHLGKSYTLETVHFAGTPPLITALANNELEVADLTYPTLPLAIQNAGLDDLRIIADEFQDGNPGYYSNEYMVAKDGPVKTVDDLKGKVLATNVAGSAVDVAMRAMLRKHKLEDKRDYTVIEAPFPTMAAMLGQKKADLISAVLPFSLNPDLRKNATTLFTTKDAVGVTQFSMWVARKGFIEKNRAAMVDFMEDMLRVTHWFEDPKNHEEVAKIASKITQVPPERFGWLFTKKDYYRDPNLVPDLDALQHNVDTVQELGFIKTHVDVKAHSDLSLVKDAVARMKK